MDTPINGVCVTVNMLKTVLSKYFNTVDDALENLEAEQIAVGEGFTSKIFRVTLKWGNRWSDRQVQNDLPQSVILKAPATDSLNLLMQHFSGGQVINSDGLVGILKNMHNNEIQAYETLGSLGIVPMANIIASKRYGDIPGFMILEDLNLRPIIKKTGETPLSLEQVLNVAEILGRFHAWCLTTDLPLKQHFTRMEDDKEGFAFFLENFHNGLMNLKQRYPQEFRMVDEVKVAKFFEMENFFRESNNHINVMDDVLVHADLWANNVMFKKDDQGKASSQVAAIIDWQISYLGCAMTDFGRMLVDFPVTFVRRNLDEILGKYYTVLMNHSKGLNITLDDVKGLFEKQYGIHALKSVIMLNGAIGIVRHHYPDEADVIVAELIKHGQQNYEEAVKILGLEV